MNTLVPAMVAEAFKDSHIVAFSTGNVYPFVNILHGGATEAVEVRSAGRLCKFVRRTRANV